jgi:hypothetical protein
MLRFVFHPELLPFVIAWEAWATFVVGLAAVFGAIRIGKNQATILARQASTEAMKLRADLYDRRIAVHTAAERFYQQTYLNLGSTPVDVRNEFYEARSRSRFIFGEDVHRFLNDMLASSRKLGAACSTVTATSEGAALATAGACENALDDFGKMEARLQVVFQPYLEIAE